ncbi:MAG: hypothetical protein ABI640_00870 [Gammaproteobacteria bacterium]
MVAVLLSVVGLAQAQPESDRIDFGAGENAMIASLTNDGFATTVGRAVVHMPRDAMSFDEARALATELNEGIEALEAFTRSPRAWQRDPARIDYYFHPSNFVSYARPVFALVFVSLSRLLSGSAPLLHETAHVLLSPRADFILARGARFDPQHDGPVWLIEGIATFVAMSVSKSAGVLEGDPLNVGRFEQLDRRCATALGTPVGDEVLPFIGAVGAPEALGSVQRRPLVAPAFYACSASFNKYLAGRIGLDALVGLMAAKDARAQFEKLAGRDVAELRADWRRGIEAGP